MIAMYFFIYQLTMFSLKDYDRFLYEYNLHAHADLINDNAQNTHLYLLARANCYIFIQHSV